MTNVCSVIPICHAFNNAKQAMRFIEFTGDVGSAASVLIWLWIKMKKSSDACRTKTAHYGITNTPSLSYRWTNDCRTLLTVLNPVVNVFRLNRAS
jgi:hypothetical protein